jgi:hypothetical protein
MRLAQLIRTIWQSSWSGPVFGLAFLAAVCGFAYLAGARQRDSGVTPDGLYIDPKYLDFGEVWEQDQFEWKLTIENRRREAIAIKNFQSSCDCAQVTPTDLRLLPGQSKEITLVVDLSLLDGPLPTNAGRYAKAEGSGRSRVSRAGDHARTAHHFNIYPVIDGDMQVPAAGWRVGGCVRTPVIVNPRVIRLGRLSRGMSVPEPAAQLRLQPGVQILDAYTNSATIRASLKGNPASLGLSISSGHELGDFRATAFLLLSDLESAERLPPFPVPIVGTLVPAVQVQPPTIHFGPNTIGSVAEAELVAHSVVGKPFATLTIHADSPDVSITSKEGATTHERVFSVRQRITRLGASRSSVSIAFQTADLPIDTVTLLVSYYGVQ